MFLQDLCISTALKTVNTLPVSMKRSYFCNSLFKYQGQENSYYCNQGQENSHYCRHFQPVNKKEALGGWCTCRKILFAGFIKNAVKDGGREFSNLSFQAGTCVDHLMSACKITFTKLYAAPSGTVIPAFASP